MGAFAFSGTMGASQEACTHMEDKALGDGAGLAFSLPEPRYMKQGTFGTLLPTQSRKQGIVETLLATRPASRERSKPCLQTPPASRERSKLCLQTCHADRGWSGP